MTLFRVCFVLYMSLFYFMQYKPLAVQNLSTTFIIFRDTHAKTLVDYHFKTRRFGKTTLSYEITHTQTVLTYSSLVGKALDYHSKGRGFDFHRGQANFSACPVCVLRVAYAL